MFLMLAKILGNTTAAKIMLYLFHYGECYAAAVSREMKMALSQVQKQLDKFEGADVLISKRLGTVRIYQFNPKLGVVKKFKELVGLFYEQIPLRQREEYFSQRKRPRRKGKPVITKRSK